eukprot:364647-Chlamydomonas_euryale.AAC.16
MAPSGDLSWHKPVSSVHAMPATMPWPQKPMRTAQEGVHGAPVSPARHVPVPGALDARPISHAHLPASPLAA